MDKTLFSPPDHFKVEQGEGHRFKGVQIEALGEPLIVQLNTVNPKRMEVVQCACYSEAYLPIYFHDFDDKKAVRIYAGDVAVAIGDCAGYKADDFAVLCLLRPGQRVEIPADHSAISGDLMIMDFRNAEPAEFIKSSY